MSGFVVLRLEGYTVPAWSVDFRYGVRESIIAVETASRANGGDNSQESREQLPLALCWAIGIHKSQGQTAENTPINLGKFDATAGLTFVCL